jgi:hypothetical protein
MINECCPNFKCDLIVAPTCAYSWLLEPSFLFYSSYGCICVQHTAVPHITWIPDGGVDALRNSGDSVHDRSPSSYQKFNLSYSWLLLWTSYAGISMSFMRQERIFFGSNCGSSELSVWYSHMYNVLYSSCPMWHDFLSKLVGWTFCVQWCWWFTLCNGGSSWLVFKDPGINFEADFLS